MRNTIIGLTASCALTLLTTDISAQQINAYRYWIDGNTAASTLVTTAATPTLHLNTALPTASLPIGQHRIALQFRDANGVWSTPTERYFTKSGAPMATWQYWFDDNVAARVDVPVTATAQVQVAAAIDASDLSNGPHTITWWMKDAMGNWSTPVSQDFDVVTGIDEVPGLDRVTVFPNPAEGQVHLRLDALAPTDLQYDVVDATGRMVVQRQRVVAQGTVVKDIAVAEWSPGVYHIRLIGERGVRSMAFVKH